MSRPGARWRQMQPHPRHAIPLIALGGLVWRFWRDLLGGILAGSHGINSWSKVEQKSGLPLGAFHCGLSGLARQDPVIIQGGNERARASMDMPARGSLVWTCPHAVRGIKPQGRGGAADSSLGQIEHPAYAPHTLSSWITPTGCAWVGWECVSVNTVLNSTAVIGPR